MNTDERTELSLAWRALVEAVGLDPATVPPLHERGLLNQQSVDAITVVANAVIENNKQWMIDQTLVAPFNTVVGELRCWRFHSHVEAEGASVRYVFPNGNARQLAAKINATNHTGALKSSGADTARTIETMKRDIELLRAEVTAWRLEFDDAIPLPHRMAVVCENTDEHISTPFHGDVAQ